MEAKKSGGRGREREREGNLISHREEEEDMVSQVRLP